MDMLAGSLRAIGVFALGTNHDTQIQGATKARGPCNLDFKIKECYENDNPFS